MLIEKPIAFEVRKIDGCLGNASYWEAAGNKKAFLRFCCGRRMTEVIASYQWPMGSKSEQKVGWHCGQCKRSTIRRSIEIELAIKEQKSQNR